MDTYPWLTKWVAMGILLLFGGTGLIPGNAQNTETPSLTISIGNWLYVGGSGPNNYTTIKRALENASSGDTIFVYGGIYYEYLYIDKKINLSGEDKNSTIIKNENDFGIIMKIHEDGVIIDGFTLQSINNVMEIYSYNILIENCIVVGSSWGIDLMGGDIQIKQCVIKENTIGIMAGNYCGNVLLERNIFSSNEDGIWIYGGRSSQINIFNNTFQNNSNIGVYSRFSEFNVKISGNTFKNNKYGIYIHDSKFNKISKNNFIDNKRANAYFNYDITHFIHFNSWQENYWHPRFIGLIPSDSKFPKIISGTLFYEIGFFYFGIPFFNIDWHPAQEPYEIPGVY